MDSKQILSKYNSRLVKEGVLKALLCGLSIGFGVAAVLLFIFWLTDFLYFWIAAIIGAVLVGIATPILYFFVFRPTAKSVAHRVDGLGLEERIITMTELKDDNSYIAQRQREDAQAALKAMDSASGAKGKGTRLPFRIHKTIIAFVVIASVAFASLQTLGILSYKGVIPKASEIMDEFVENEDAYHTVSYYCYGNGEIIGDPDQVVADGEDATVVMADAEEGWYFAGWIDSEFVTPDDVGLLMLLGLLDSVITSEDPYRVDKNITSDIQPIAVFIEMSDGDGDGGDGEGDEGEPVEGEDGVPSDGEGDEGEPGNGPPKPGDEGNNGQGGNDPHGDPSNGQTGGAGNPKQDDSFIDGQSQLKDFFGELYEGAKDQLSDGNNLPDDLRDIGEGYYDGLKP